MAGINVLSVLILSGVLLVVSAQAGVPLLQKAFGDVIPLRTRIQQTSLIHVLNQFLPEDVKGAIEKCRACEDWEIAQGVLDNIIENYEIAGAQEVPICQDTGMACVFLEIGQDVHLTGGDLTEAVNEGVRRGYDKGYLRKSVVKDPVRRGNTGDNTPAMLYTEIVPG